MNLRLLLSLFFLLLCCHRDFFKWDSWSHPHTGRQMVLCSVKLPPQSSAELFGKCAPSPFLRLARRLRSSEWGTCMPNRCERNAVQRRRLRLLVKAFSGDLLSLRAGTGGESRKKKNPGWGNMKNVLTSSDETLAHTIRTVTLFFTLSAR